MAINKFSGKLFFFLALLLAFESLARDICIDPVMTGSGLVQGLAETDTATCAWKGIPYAQPPVGELRWKAPRPAPSWAGIRAAHEWGHRCMQKGALGGPSRSGEDMSEDCLYLNVWRPAKPGNFPVMVWIHGGGYHTGASHEPAYWGDRLSEAGDVIVVSTNYRLNIFGFMAHPGLREEDPHGSTGGYGTMDQAFALKWVHDNIEVFGGDPAHVTIFGESAGGASVCSMIATPLARGLFHRAIFQSGSGNSSRSLDYAFQLARESFAKAGCEFNDLECMRQMPADRLLEKAAVSMLDSFDYFPCEDGWVLRATPEQMIRSGDFNRVPIMVGSNLDEFARAVNLIPRYYFILPSRYERYIHHRLGATPEEAKRLIELYPLDEFGNRPRRALGRMYASDAVLTCTVRSSASAIAEQGLPAYLYRFEYQGMKYAKFLGSFHGAEIPFIFGALDRPPASELFNEKNLAEARKLSRTMQGYCLNFAKTGDPNGDGLPAWERFDPAGQRVQILDTTVQNEPHPAAERCDFWDGYSQPYIQVINGLLKELNP